MIGITGIGAIAGSVAVPIVSGTWLIGRLMGRQAAQSESVSAKVDQVSASLDSGLASVSSKLDAVHDRIDDHLVWHAGGIVTRNSGRLSDRD